MYEGELNLDTIYSPINNADAPPSAPEKDDGKSELTLDQAVSQARAKRDEPEQQVREIKWEAPDGDKPQTIRQAAARVTAAKQDRDINELLKSGVKAEDAFNRVLEPT